MDRENGLGSTNDPLPRASYLHMDELQEQLAAATELLRDGMPRKEVVDRLIRDYSLSPATAYRRVSDALEALNPDGEAVDLAEAALATMLRLMRAAEATGDDETAMKRAEALAAAVSKLKILRIRA